MPSIKLTKNIIDSYKILNTSTISMNTISMNTISMNVWKSKSKINTLSINKITTSIIESETKTVPMILHYDNETFEIIVPQDKSEYDDKMIIWLLNNCEGKFYITEFLDDCYFQYKSDAIAFKLTFNETS